MVLAGIVPPLDSFVPKASSQNGIPPYGMSTPSFQAYSLILPCCLTTVEAPPALVTDSSLASTDFLHSYVQCGLLTGLQILSSSTMFPQPGKITIS